MTNFPNVVDNHVISNEATLLYVQGSAKIRHDVAAVVANYSVTTSDHYPVFSQYLLGMTTPVSQVYAGNALQVAANWSGGDLLVHAGSPLQKAKITLTDMQGRQLANFSLGRMAAGATRRLPLPSLNSGIYLLHLHTEKGSKVLKVMK